MRWALTGASGFVGRALSAAAMERGIIVRGLTREARLTAGVETVRGDLSDVGALARLVRGVDVVVHLGAYVHREASTETERRECRAVNIDGTARLVEAVAAERSSPFLIFMSSANVYALSDDPVEESSPIAPRTIYGWTKLEAEGVVLDSVGGGAIRGCVLRPATIVGAGAPGNLDRLVHMVQRGVVIDLAGGRQQKTLVPLGNVVSACFAVRDNGVNGEIYNVGGPVLTMRRITAMIARILSVSPLRVPVPPGVALAGTRAFDVCFGTSSNRLVRTYASNTIVSDAKLRTLAGYDPVPDIEASLQATIAAPIAAPVCRH